MENSQNNSQKPVDNQPEQQAKEFTTSDPTQNQQSKVLDKQLLRLMREEEARGDD